MLPRQNIVVVGGEEGAVVVTLRAPLVPPDSLCGEACISYEKCVGAGVGRESLCCAVTEPPPSMAHLRAATYVMWACHGMCMRMYACVVAGDWGSARLKQ